MCLTSRVARGGTPAREVVVVSFSFFSSTTTTAFLSLLSLLLSFISFFVEVVSVLSTTYYDVPAHWERKHLVIYEVNTFPATNFSLSPPLHRCEAALSPHHYKLPSINYPLKTTYYKLPTIISQ